MKTNDLTRKQAEIRKEQVSEVSYKINLSINKIDLEYNGKTMINFNFNNVKSEMLIIDCVSKKIEYIYLNGKSFTNYEKNDFRKYWF